MGHPSCAHSTVTRKSNLNQGSDRPCMKTMDSEEFTLADKEIKLDTNITKNLLVSANINVLFYQGNNGQGVRSKKFIWHHKSSWIEQQIEGIFTKTQPYKSDVKRITLYYKMAPLSIFWRTKILNWVATKAYNKHNSFYFIQNQMEVTKELLFLFMVILTNIAIVELASRTQPSAGDQKFGH